MESLSAGAMRLVRVTGIYILMVKSARRRISRGELVIFLTVLYVITIYLQKQV